MAHKRNALRGCVRIAARRHNALGARGAASLFTPDGRRQVVATYGRKPT